MPLVKGTRTQNLAKVNKSLGHWELTAGENILNIAAKLGHLFTSTGIDFLSFICRVA